MGLLLGLLFSGASMIVLKAIRESHAKRQERNRLHGSNEALTVEQLTKLKIIHQTFEEVFPISVEDMCDDFESDVDTNAKIALWMKMKTVYEDFLATRSFPRKELKGEVFRILTLQSMIDRKTIETDIKNKYLTSDDVRGILDQLEN